MTRMTQPEETLRAIFAGLACSHPGCGCQRPGSHMTHCPVHDDSKPSLSVTTRNGKVLVKCHGDCSQEQVLAALRERSLWSEKKAAGPPRARAKILATYDYREPGGRLRYQVVRYDPKKFKQRRPDPANPDAWVWNLRGVEPLLYRLPELAAADLEEWVFVVEGEKDVEALRSIGINATCNSGGAGKWPVSAAQHLRDRRVVLLPDQDPAGRQHADDVRTKVLGAVRELRQVDLPVKDAAEWVAAQGHTREELLQLVEAAAPPEPEDGAGLLEDVRAFVTRYVRLPADPYADVVALWIAHTHAIEAADDSARLLFKSPEKECGKTRALEVLQAVVRAPMLTFNVTVSAIFRTLIEEPKTLLVDEADVIFKPRAGVEQAEDLRALLNAGYRRGATVRRCVGNDLHVEAFPVFAATAVASIGDLPDTIESRGITIPMRRRVLTEAVDRFRPRRVNGEADRLRERLGAWAEAHVHELSAADPELPDSLSDRQQDVWEPLFAIADAAGGDWPKRAADAAAYVAGDASAEDASTGVRLLSGIRDAIGMGDRITSAGLCEVLNRQPEAPWGRWNDGRGIEQRDVAQRLRHFGVSARDLRLPGGAVRRGYLAADLHDAFARYLGPPGSSATAATGATPDRIDVAGVAPVAHTPRETNAEQDSLLFDDRPAEMMEDEEAK